MSKQEEVSNGPRTGLWEKTTRGLCVCQWDARTRALVHTPTLSCISEAALLLHLLHTRLNKSTQARQPHGSLSRGPLEFQLDHRIPKAICGLTPDGCHGNCPPLYWAQ